MIDKINHRFPFEALCWMAGLILLAVFEPSAPNSGFSFCLFHHIGWENCPGCGLGTSIALFFRGQITESIAAHPLGIIITFALIYRIIVLSINNYRHGKSYRHTS